MMKRADFVAPGGFGEILTGSEDWNLALRVTASGAAREHTAAYIRHDATRVAYLAHRVEKGRFAVRLHSFMVKHRARGAAVVLDRPYLRRPW